MQWRELEGTEDMSQEERPPPPPGLEALFSEEIVVLGALLGILFMFIGRIIGVYARSVDVTQASSALIYIGALLLTGILTAGGLRNKELDKFVRLGMLIAAGLVISSTFG